MISDCEGYLVMFIPPEPDQNIVFYVQSEESSNCEVYYCKNSEGYKLSPQLPTIRPSEGLSPKSFIHNNGGREYQSVLSIIFSTSSGLDYVCYENPLIWIKLSVRNNIRAPTSPDLMLTAQAEADNYFWRSFRN